MNDNRKPTILITEKRTLRSCISKHDLSAFNIIRNHDPREVFSLVSIHHPDLIILDAEMDDVSGYDLLRTLKSFYKTERIPVVLVAEITEDVEPCLALELGAIDFMIKPISEHLVTAKINNYIKIYHSLLLLEEKAHYAKEMNPNTGLPGNMAISRYITNALKSRKDNVVVYADLDNFKSYNDKYGFGRGDEIIKFTGGVIASALSEALGDTFLGHIGGDDFVFVASADEVKDIANNIIYNFDQKIRQHYCEEDKASGFIISKDRLNTIQKYPIMTISLAGVRLLEHPETTRYEVIADICAEVKKYAKTFNNSCFYMDRRQGEDFRKKYDMAFSTVM
jgi:PleD family two-component response regulator